MYDIECIKGSICEHSNVSRQGLSTPFIYQPLLKIGFNSATPFYIDDKQE